MSGVLLRFLSCSNRRVARAVRGGRRAQREARVHPTQQEGAAARGGGRGGSALRGTGRRVRHGWDDAGGGPALLCCCRIMSYAV